MRRAKPLVHPPLIRPPRVVLCIALFFSITRHLLPSPPPPRLPTLPEELPPHKCPSTRRPPIYVFLHMHKTAGNALKRSLFAFATRNNLTLFHTCHPALPDSPLVAWLLNRHKSLTGLDCNLHTLHSLPPANRSTISIIAGHQHHGAHTLFPSRPPRYFTFLRHPLHRKTSHFLHFEPANASISNYLLTQNRNYMTKRLAIRTPSSDLILHLRATAIDTDPFSAAAALSAAKSHLLRHFFFVGLHHRHAQSLCILAHILNRACRGGYGRRGRWGWRGGGGGDGGDLDGGVVERLADAFPMQAGRVAAERANVRGRTGEVVASLPETVRKKAMEAEGMDMQLFEFAQRLFEAKLAQYRECQHIRE